MIIIGWVNLAMLKILTVSFPEHSPETLLVIFGLFTLAYVTVTGLGGVAAADVFQFLVAMTGSVALAILALHSVGGVSHITAILPPEKLSFLPSSGDMSISGGGMVTFLTFVAVQWWASWYPGAEPGGGGYVAQRILSAKSEDDGILATLWFTVAHYAIRPWPWILAGLAALVLYPNLADRESGYVLLMRDVLPSPFRGLLIAAFAGAYMSTLSTQLNWGASYAINDFYSRFWKTDGDDRHYVAAGRVVTLLIFLLSIYVTFNILNSISGAWKILLEFGAGSGFILILRWFWWRINALTELVSVITPVVMVLIIRFLLPLIFDGDSLGWISSFPGSLLFISAVTVVFSLFTAYVSAPEQGDTLMGFVQKVNPPGPGWNSIRAKLASGEGWRGPENKLWPLFLGWFAGLLTVYSLLFFIGSMILQRQMEAMGWGALLGLGVAILGILFSKKLI